MDVKTGYGLLHIASGKLCGVYTQSNAGADCCCEEQHILNHTCEQPWIVEDNLTASYVRTFSTQWYNAGYETPTHDYKPEELEVVQITIKATRVVPIKIPTLSEYIEMRYNDPKKKYYDPRYAEFAQNELVKHPNTIPYSIYELWDLYRMI